MFLRNSRWPGASMITYVALEACLNQIWVVSMVTAWSRSAWKASRTKDHSIAMPRARRTAFSSSNLPGGRESVS